MPLWAAHVPGAGSAAWAGWRGGHPSLPVASFFFFVFVFFFVSFFYFRGPAAQHWAGAASRRGGGLVLGVYAACGGRCGHGLLRRWLAAGSRERPGGAIDRAVGGGR